MALVTSIKNASKISGIDCITKPTRKGNVTIVLIPVQTHRGTSFDGSHTDVTVPAINDLDILWIINQHCLPRSQETAPIHELTKSLYTIYE